MAACAGAFGLSVLALRLARPKRKILVKESKAIPADLMNYVLPYVVAFMVLDYKDPTKLLGFLVFFVWIFVITHRSGQVILNPVLAVIGWQLYEVTYVIAGGEADYTGYILSRVPLDAGRAFRYDAIQNVLIVKNGNDEP